MINQTYNGWPNYCSWAMFAQYKHGEEHIVFLRSLKERVPDTAERAWSLQNTFLAAYALWYAGKETPYANLISNFLRDSMQHTFAHIDWAAVYVAAAFGKELASEDEHLLATTLRDICFITAMDPLEEGAAKTKTFLEVMWKRWLLAGEDRSKMARADVLYRAFVTLLFQQIDWKSVAR